MKNGGTGRVSFFVVFFTLLAGLFGLHESKAADYLTASGCSISNVGYLTELAKEYERHTGVKVFVRGGGSVVGIEDLRSGRVDFAAACRSREEGDPKDVEFTQVAWDALVFIVHKSNSAENITLDEARSVYSGRITNWAKLKGTDRPIKIFVSKPQKGLSGVDASAKQLFLKDNDPYKAKNTVFVASSGLVEQMVEDTPGGFAVSGFTSARKRDVKMLKIGGIPPTVKNIISGKYPLKRPLFFLTSRQPSQKVKRFVDFTLSKEGQRFINSQGVVALMDIK